MPADVMLKAMRAHYKAGRLDQAASIAKDAAPYFHPRLASVEMKAAIDQRHITEFTDAELEAMIAAEQRRLRIAEAATGEEGPDSVQYGRLS